MLSRSVIIDLSFALAAAVLVTGCGANEPPEDTAPPAARRDTALLSPEAARLAGFTIAPAESLGWREVWTVPARITLDPTETQTLGAIAEGRVTRVMARVGDRVRRGDVLVAVHSHEMLDALSALAKARAADAEAAADSSLAERAASRAERLYSLKALSLAELEQARASLARARSLREQARAELARAQAMYDHLVGGDVPEEMDEHEVLVRSPIDGIVVSLDARPGAVVLVGAPLVAVSRTTSLALLLQLPERALGVARAGAAVRFGVPAFPGEMFDAQVTRVAPVLDSATRTLTIQARVTSGLDRLRAEMYATAELTGAASASVLSVPASAVQALEGDTVVIAAREQPNGLALEALRVRIGRRTAERAEILDGLTAGTPVVAGGASIAKAELLRRRGGA